MIISMFRCVIALVVSADLWLPPSASCSIPANAWYTAGFCLLALVIQRARARDGDPIGAATKNPGVRPHHCCCGNFAVIWLMASSHCNPPNGSCTGFSAVRPRPNRSRGLNAFRRAFRRRHSRRWLRWTWLVVGPAPALGVGCDGRIFTWLDNGGGRTDLIPDQVEWNGTPPPRHYRRGGCQRGMRMTVCCPGSGWFLSHRASAAVAPDRRGRPIVVITSFVLRRSAGIPLFTQAFPVRVAPCPAGSASPFRGGQRTTSPCTPRTPGAAGHRRSSSPPSCSFCGSASCRSTSSRSGCNPCEHQPCSCQSRCGTGERWPRVQNRSGTLLVVGGIASPLPPCRWRPGTSAG